MLGNKCYRLSHWRKQQSWRNSLHLPVPEQFCWASSAKAWVWAWLDDFKDLQLSESCVCCYKISWRTYFIFMKRKNKNTSLLLTFHPSTSTLPSHCTAHATAIASLPTSDRCSLSPHLATLHKHKHSISPDTVRPTHPATQDQPIAIHSKGDHRQSQLKVLY